MKDRTSHLSEEQKKILFQEGTELPFSSVLNNEKRGGTYHCASCNTPIFKSIHKFNSGTGWPSFFSAIEGALDTKIDRKHGMIRTEYHCANCGAHQGHLFEDGPSPSGLRYCNNGLALRFIKEKA